MSIAGLFAHFGMKQLFDVSSREVVEWVDSRFTDTSQKPARVILIAYQRAWDVVEAALSDHSFWERVRDPARDGDLKKARNDLRGLLDQLPPTRGLRAAELRTRAAAELTRLRQTAAFGAPTLPPGTADDFRRYSDLSALFADADRAATELADTIEPEVPHLAAVLELAPDGKATLFVTFYRHFLRVGVAKDPDLSARLTHDQLRSLAEQTDARTAGILDQFDVLFDVLHARISELKEQARAGFAEMGGRLHEHAEHLRDMKAQLDELAARQRSGRTTVASEEERDLLRRVKADYRAGRVTPELWHQLGDVERAAKLYREAAESHTAAATAAEQARDNGVAAANHFSAYLNACDAGLWETAFVALWKAVELDPAGYAPFDRHRYRPERILGGGAFGTVFLCHDEFKDGRPLAIKSFRTDVHGRTKGLDRDLTKVFAEARTLERLPHPNIITIVDQGFGNSVTRRHPYLILEYFPGVTLDKLIPLAVADFLPIARRVAEAVHAAHTRPQPIYHRDLKPANIMAQKNPDGTWAVKVIDFGLAVRVAVARVSQQVPEANRATSDKSLTGTLKYAPPEQTGDLPGVEVGAHSDVYAFGKTCQDVLFGTTAPKSWDWAKLSAELRGPLHELLERCTAEPLEHRHPNFEPVLKMLTQLDPAGKAARERERQAEEAERARRAEAEARRIATEQAQVQRVRLAAEAAARGERERLQREAAEQQVRDEAARLEAERQRKAEEKARRQAEAIDRKRQEQAEHEEEDRRKAEQKTEADERAEREQAEREATRQRKRLRQREEERRANQTTRRRVLGCLAASLGSGGVLTGAWWVWARKQPQAEQPPVPLNPTAGDLYAVKIDGVEMKFCWCPPGSFQMGGTVHDSEKPVHKVTITKGFWMGQTEVTQSQWKVVIRTAPSYFKGVNRPVECVSWNECQEFCTKLTVVLKGPVSVRLPTEAQWEYACRAGTTTEYWSGNDEAALKRVGWYAGNSRETQPVGQLASNAWGLYDVHGNVWEWCVDGKRGYTAQDDVDPIENSNNNYCILRGGAWSDDLDGCRAAYRGWGAPGSGRYDVGFRVCFRLD
jgi:formylglycine-generating enzyme required for sulfatase activity